MEIPSKPFYAKLLLFGEYTVIRGSQALAMPYQAFKGSWQFSKDSDSNAQAPLYAILKFLQQQIEIGKLPPLFKINKFKRDLENGLTFQSDIPRGYGIGSSGALSAALYESYFREQPTALESIRQHLAVIESYFHGSSSGIDPLISYLNAPIVLDGRGGMRKIELPRQDEDGQGAFFLLDTGQSRQTGPLVEIFLNKCEDPNFEQLCSSSLGGLNNRVIQAFLAGEWDAIAHLFQQISLFQWRYFKEMIPDSVRGIWEQGLDHKVFSLKLCGAGGGGFLLGYTPDEGALQELMPERKLLPVFRFS